MSATDTKICLTTSTRVLGLLSIGKRPQDYLPGAYIQFLRIGGTAITDEVIDSAELGGDVSTLVNRVTDKLVAHNSRAVDVTSDVKHRITSSYPLPVLLQIVYNAILHRSYEHTNAPVRITWFDDRVEVISPGGPGHTAM